MFGKTQTGRQDLPLTKTMIVNFKKSSSVVTVKLNGNEIFSLNQHKFNFEYDNQGNVCIRISSGVGKQEWIFARITEISFTDVNDLTHFCTSQSDIEDYVYDMFIGAGDASRI